MKPPPDQSDFVGCGAYHGGCGCIGAWDCAHDNKLERVEDTLRTLFDSWDQDTYRSVALACLRATFGQHRLAFDEGER